MLTSTSKFLNRIFEKIPLLLCLLVPQFTNAASFSGTGFFISSEGYIATNNHVIEDGDEISVKDCKGNITKASVVLRDTANDLAIIKIKQGEYQTLAIRHSSGVKKGTEVFAIGFPNISIQGRESKVTTGIVSSLSGLMGEPNNFQISVPIQPGNSGGPLVDMTGAVVGITTAKLNAAAMLQRGSSLPENVNYAVKSAYLFELLSTDENIAPLVDKYPGQKSFPLTTLVAKAEKAVVLIVVNRPDKAVPEVAPPKIAQTPQAKDRRPEDVYSMDAGISAQATSLIKQKYGGDVHVNISCFNRSALITGEVPSESIWLDIQKIVSSIRIVKSYVNQLRISPPSSEQSRYNDLFITKKVKESLSQQLPLIAHVVVIVTEAGAVYLQGVVTQQEGYEICEVVRKIPGVLKVVRHFEFI